MLICGGKATQQAGIGQVIALEISRVAKDSGTGIEPSLCYFGCAPGGAGDQRRGRL